MERKRGGKIREKMEEREEERELERKGRYITIL